MALNERPRTVSAPDPDVCVRPRRVRKKRWLDSVASFFFSAMACVGVAVRKKNWRNALENLGRRVAVPLFFGFRRRSKSIRVGPPPRIDRPMSMIETDPVRRQRCQ